MGRAETLEGKMSTQDPSDLWSRSDGEAELLQDLGENKIIMKGQSKNMQPKYREKNVIELFMKMGLEPSFLTADILLQRMHRVIGSIFIPLEDMLFQRMLGDNLKNVIKVTELYTWYHSNLTRHAAEALLLSNGRDGSYLLRDSNERIGLYSLSVRAKDSVKHFHVEYTGYSFKFGFNEFPSLKDFVKHFANQPLIGSETGTLIVLKHPYPRKVEEPSIYESVRVHTAMQTGRTENDLVPTAPSLGTKEGYLTKQGGLVKTWKTRWFTLHRNELKYFKDQMSPEPIRILDLTECSAVQFDYSQEKVNCFCLVFPFRTFYLCAKTGVEADEWIKILRWKLSQIRKKLDQGDGTIQSQSFVFK